MQKPTLDPGLTQSYSGVLKRAINKDGQFNVRRAGGSWRDIHPYLILINTSWPRFSGCVALAFVVANLIFAALYMLAGIENLKGIGTSATHSHFLNAFFFSAHTLTTVGYGNIYPSGIATNAIAVFESLTGLLAFAVATGLMFGRFSKATARIGFSDQMLVAPYMGAASLQFRVVNRRANNLIEISVQLLLMTVEPVDGVLQRKFQRLDLERDQVTFLALTWTIVHPINESSPLFGKTAADLQSSQAEVLVMLKGFDETFGQTVHSRFSYRFDEIHWGAKFLPAFQFEKDGAIRLEINSVGLRTPVELDLP